ncbi:MAG: hypothetical protein M3042_12995 [Actinomycetota bacterium]|nr:hypothetical protein [Actinomycetota bacterium]
MSTIRWEPLLAAVLAAVPITVLALLGAKGGDMQAQLYRSELARHGTWLWDNNWYDGLYLPSYSVLYPPLAGLVGNVLLVALGGVVASALFMDLALRTWGRTARWGGYVFALLACTPLLTGEYPYSLGITAMLAALCCLSRHRLGAALACAALTVAFAPLAFAFLVFVLAGLAAGSGRPDRAAIGFGVGITAVGAVGATVVLLMPVPGLQTFPFVSLWPALVALGAGAVAGLMAGDRARRRLGTVLLVWSMACVGLSLVPTSIGYNVTRIRLVLFAVLVAALAGSRRPQGRTYRAFAAVALIASFIWTAQLFTEVVPDSLHARFAAASRWQPVNTFLAGHWTPDYRVEVAPTYDHWEAYWVGRRFPLARGWYRQADLDRNGLLYRPLTARAYQGWLRDNAVRYVVVPPGPSESHFEAALLRSGDSGLRPVWSAAGFTIWELPRPARILRGSSAARLTRYGHDSISGTLPAAGTYQLRLRYNRYWRVTGDLCVGPAADGTTLLTASRPTRFTLGQPRGPAELFGGRPRCTGA